MTVCGVGRTAAIATDLLRANGVEALTLDGGMRAWSLAWNTAQTTISGCEVVQVRRTGKGCLSYIVESQSEAVVIDASVDPDVYVRLLRERGWRLVAVADTHIHADHLSRSRRLAHLEGAALVLPAQDRAQYPFRPVADGDRIAFRLDGPGCHAYPWSYGGEHHLPARQHRRVHGRHIVSQQRGQA